MQSASELRLEIELLEKILAEVDGRGRHGDDRLLQALQSLIAEKRAKLGGS